jgi:hypothetical protein
MSDDWIPPGFVDVTALVRQHGIDKVRNDLFSGRLQAYLLDAAGANLIPMESRLWCGHSALYWLETGYCSGPNDRQISTCKVIVPAEDEPKPPPATDGVYLSPFMVMMLEAVRHFKINEQRWPKKGELEAYFLAQKLPDGTPITANQARNLATFCRPLAAMSGGNNKGG